MFFYVGGTKWLRGVQKACGVLPPAKDAGKGVNGNGAVTATASSSGTATPLAEKNFTVPPSLDKLVAPPS